MFPNGRALEASNEKHATENVRYSTERLSEAVSMESPPPGRLHSIDTACSAPRSGEKCMET